ncbi:hypothetical protein VA7868_00918 [Vibrio aerogenes CECT 7868]|uniref:Uncharacterized protein n=1 Tax=Vibrio aerogenes CECT 7868 TaxID=1216006 RepID=A0A1M5WZM9_9VIBR|nr:hypothetical protein VA7868_00918 [Vibrio aerogenes CECT 7868]
MLKTQPSYKIIISYLLEIILLSFFNGFIFLGLFISFIYDTLLKNNQTGSIFIPVMTSILTLIYLSFHRYRKYKNEGIWLLKNDTLHQGDTINFSIELNKIQALITCRPSKKMTNYIGRKGNNIGAYNFIEDGRLIIKIDSHTYLPLYLHEYKNGKLIMDTLVQSFQPKLIENYQFNLEECHNLTMKNRNKLVRTN